MDGDKEYSYYSVQIWDGTGRDKTHIFVLNYMDGDKEYSYYSVQIWDGTGRDKTHIFVLGQRLIQTLARNHVHKSKGTGCGHFAGYPI